MVIEFILIAAILVFVFIYTKRIDSKKFFGDVEPFLSMLKEEDYEFLLKLKYGGDDLDVNKLFNQRIKTAAIVLLGAIIFFLFTSNFTFINALISVILAFLVFKSPYSSLNSYYKKHLSQINQMLPYYLKSLEILVQHYTVPVALAKSVDTAPEIFKPGLKKLIELLRIIKSNNIKYKVIGNGSNLLFSDKQFDGIIIKLNEFNDIEFMEKNKVRVGAGYPLNKLCIQCAKKGLTGLEFAAGIPASIGGAIYMNAGAYKSDMGYIVLSVKVLTPDFRVINLVNKEMNFHYRTSFLQFNKDYVCLEAVIKLINGKKDAIESVMKDRRERRIESQPLEYPSAGSVFRNPEGNFAGKLIEDVGLKGKIYGGAMISDKHANFIVNTGNATAEDVRRLIQLAQEKVKEKYNVDLVLEQEYVNWE